MKKNPFALVTEELRALRAKLHHLTYQALFGRTLEERQYAGRQAADVHRLIEEKLTATWYAAGQVTDFVRGPVHEDLLTTLDNFIHLVEVPAGATPAADSCPVPPPQFRCPGPPPLAAQ